MPSLAEIDIHLPGILLAYTVLAIGICSPGPAVLAIIGTAMERGRRPGLFLALGVVCGSAFWGVAAAVGLSTVLTTYAQALVVFKVVGGLFLLWLAFKALRSAIRGGTAATTVRNERPSRLWMTGFLIHMTNPKAILAWIATIALGVTPTSPLWVSFAIVLGGIAISLLGNLAYALLFSTRRAAALYARARRPIEIVFAAFFGLAGVKLLTSRA